MSKVTYQIRVAGPLPPDVVDNFVGVSVVSMLTDTTFRVDLVDTSALNGLLAALRHEGLVLLGLRCDHCGDDDNGTVQFDDHGQTGSTGASAELDEDGSRHRQAGGGERDAP